MIKAAVFSDTHGNTALMLETVRRVRPDVLIHLGDHERDAQELRREFPEIPLYCVRGNCDLCSFAPDTDIVPLGSVKAFITHGHLYHVEYNRVDSLVYAAQEQGCRVAMFGHTHSAYEHYEDGLYLLNPGSCAAPRGGRPSCGIVEIAGGSIITNIAEL